MCPTFSIIIIYICFLQRQPEARSLLLALGVCYLARLEEATRKKYAEAVSTLLQDAIGARNQIRGPQFLFHQIELYVVYYYLHLLPTCHRLLFAFLCFGS